ncbi:MAG: isoprenylcysteine carboxylmethyltransferase family protein [Patescibacteria group bacterium]|nr:isoprenylcysteine carboxylmethyltransferase family protein [Patescibacteria group bacterium]
MQYTDLIGRMTSDAWILFALVWLVSAFFTKKYAKRAGARWWVVRLLFVAVILIFIKLSGMRGAFLLWYLHEPAARWAGMALTFAGIAVAFWARFNLGRNWGQPMSEKKDAELVTSGPYAYIRNPIYSGIFLAMAGSILVFGMLWILVLVPFAAYILPSVFAEERIMARLFPDAYPSYKARTKRLIPWVW